VSNVTNCTKGMGLRQPVDAGLFDSDQLGCFMVSHKNPGMGNPTHGVAFDFQHAVDHQSIHGYTLCHFYAPEEPGHDKSDKKRSTLIHFTHFVAALMSTSGLYWEYINLWNQRHPGRQFVAQMGPVCYYRHLVLQLGASANLMLNMVAEVFIHNSVDPAEIDHTYTFGIRYLNDTYSDDPIHQSMFDELDDR
ncbi:hypothetical protein AN958_02702, partial [Leucoagaricus sp. SymC.cos]